MGQIGFFVALLKYLFFCTQYADENKTTLSSLVKKYNWQEIGLNLKLCFDDRLKFKRDTIVIAGFGDHFLVPRCSDILHLVPRCSDILPGS